MNLVLLIGLLTALTVALLAWQVVGRSHWLQSSVRRQLDAMYAVPDVAASQPSPNSIAYKVAAVGFRTEKPALLFWSVTMGLALTVPLVASLIGMPVLPAAVLGVLAGYGPTAWLDGRIAGRGREVDRALPTALSRIAATLQANPSLATALETVADSLDAQEPNPLAPELRLTAREMGDAEIGRYEALRRLARRSPSVSLANAAQLFETFVDAGGGEYTHVLNQIAAKVQQILVARNRAVARAGDALLSAKVIPAVLVFVLVVLGQDPLARATLSAGPVQLILALAVVTMAVGYVVMRSMVQEAA